MQDEHPIRSSTMDCAKSFIDFTDMETMCSSCKITLASRCYYCVYGVISMHEATRSDSIRIIDPWTSDVRNSYMVSH